MRPAAGPEAASPRQERSPRPRRPRRISFGALLHYLPHLAVALLVLGAFVLVWRAEGDDPLWDERWRALPPEERRRIAAAARSGTLLASQEEIELAAGFARRERRRRRPGRLIASFRLPLGLAALGVGVLADSVALIVFGVLFLLLGVWSLARNHRIGRGLRETISRDRGL